jgi:hypothetical protein
MQRAEPPPSLRRQWLVQRPRRLSQRFYQVLTAILLAVFALLLIWPVATVIITGFTTRSGEFTLAYTRLLL